MKQDRGDTQIVRNFRLRQGRQHLAITAALVFVVILAVLYNRPDLFGSFSKNAVLGAQITLIAAFTAFSALNWRCPSCNKYLGSNINRRICNKCGARLR